MANLQYIGPRVVPKPYRNPDTGNAEWKSGIEYEALTMVTYLSNGYVSAKPVPSSVGNPASNPDYWVESADFDAALSDLQTRVIALETQNGDEVLHTTAETLSGAVNELNTQVVNTPTNRKFILIGDSFGYGVVGGGAPRGTGWLEGFAQNMPVGTCFYLNDTEVSELEGVAGFCSTLPFLDILTEIYNTKFTSVNPTEITDIVVLGGSNDLGVGATVSDLDIAIKAFITYANSHFPNARIKIGVLAKKIYDIYNGNVSGGYRRCMKYNAEFIEDLFGLCIIPTYYSADGTHLTADGYTYYQPYINQAIISGHCHYDFEFQVAATFDNTVLDSPPAFTAIINHNERSTKVAFSYSNSTFKEWPVAYLSPVANDTGLSNFITLGTAVEFPKRYKPYGNWLNLCEITADSKTVVNPCQHVFYFVSDQTHLGANVGNSATSIAGINRMLIQIDPAAAEYVPY